MTPLFSPSSDMKMKSLFVIRMIKSSTMWISLTAWETLVWLARPSFDEKNVDIFVVKDYSCSWIMPSSMLKISPVSPIPSESLAIYTVNYINFWFSPVPTKKGILATWASCLPINLISIGNILTAFTVSLIFVYYML